MYIQCCYSYYLFSSRTFPGARELVHPRECALDHVLGPRFEPMATARDHCAQWKLLKQWCNALVSPPPPPHPLERVGWNLLGTVEWCRHEAHPGCRKLNTPSVFPPSFQQPPICFLSVGLPFLSISCTWDWLYDMTLCVLLPHDQILTVFKSKASYFSRQVLLLSLVF